MTGTLEFRLFASANSRPVYNYAAVTPYLSTCMQSRAGGSCPLAEMGLKFSISPTDIGIPWRRMTLILPM
ncbi:hypothetical protein T05_3584 [Trichinella murrelli]|uniref:Uncharacterized protein n=1 Tax=Trichinella murrelli TaxID=144512 RepID=A0A0V0TED5_9BILA|nr:hypothetical protein T05_3584 [Trichinella murrelli]